MFRTSTLALAALVGAAAAPAARAQTVFDNLAPIQIPDHSNAVPYPSIIQVEGLKRPIAHVSVTLHGLTHPFPNDVGVLLVGPGGQTCLLMGQCDGPTPGVSGVTYTFDDSAPTSLTGAANSPSGTYRPSECYYYSHVPLVGPFPAPAPSGTFGAALNVFSGTGGNGVWSLFVHDFVPPNAGLLSGGWSLSITEAGAPHVEAHGAGITIPDFGTAAPYPSMVSFSGLTGKIASVAVRLHGVTHTYPRDINILLVGPNLQTCSLWHHCGNNAGLSNAEIGFADTAPGPLPGYNAGPIISGTYRPTDTTPATNFSAPAPVGPYGATLSAFAGGNPNGTWSLYVLDDGLGDSGSISGWDLALYLATPCKADFNDNGEVSVQDIFDFLAAWFAGCP